MNITVDHNGNRKVRLTKTEAKMLERVNVLCDTLASNGFNLPYSKDAATALANMESGHDTSKAKGDLSHSG